MEFSLVEMMRDEIKNFARSVISRFGWTQPSTADSVVESAVQAFVDITPRNLRTYQRRNKEVPAEISNINFSYSYQIGGLVMKEGGRGGGYSRKPGNIYLDWEKLIEIVPEVTLAASGGATLPYWAWPLIGLYIWNRLWCGAEEDLSEAEATIIYALWKNKNGHNQISEDDGYTKTNSIRDQQGMLGLSRSQYNAAINHLLQMSCIEIEEGMISLQEWVRIEY